jgi:hypothetical protein
MQEKPAQAGTDDGGAGRKPSEAQPRSRVITIHVTDREWADYEASARAEGYVSPDGAVQLEEWAHLALAVVDACGNASGGQAALFKRASMAEHVSITKWLVAAGEQALARGGAR